MHPSSWGVQRGPDGFFWGGCCLCLVEREVAVRNGKLKGCVFTGFPAVRCTELAFLSFCICKTSVIDGRSELVRGRHVWLQSTWTHNFKCDSPSLRSPGVYLGSF